MVYNIHLWVYGLCLSSGILNNYKTSLSEAGSVSGEGTGTLCWVQWLRLALSKGPNRVGLSLSSPEDGKRSSFRNIAFYSYLEFRTMDAVHKLSDSENLYVFDIARAYHTSKDQIWLLH
jgi:hypothetical protein